MKKIIIGLFAIVSFSAIAQNTSLEYRIERRLEVLNDLVARQRAHLNLPQQDKEDILRNINQSILSIRNDGPTNPDPGPINNIIAEGRIENHSFTFSGPTVGAVFNQCSDFIRTKLSQADELYVSFNGNAYIQKTTTGYWYGADQICNVIYQLMTPQNLTPERPIGYTVVEGYLENLRVEFVGNTHGEIFNKCMKYTETRLTQADEMEISVNGGRRERFTTTGYWYGANQICRILTQKVPR